MYQIHCIYTVIRPSTYRKVFDVEQNICRNFIHLIYAIGTVDKTRVYVPSKKKPLIIKHYDILRLNHDGL